MDEQTKFGQSMGISKLRIFLKVLLVIPVVGMMILQFSTDIF
jgi:hypothetical protein